METLIAAAGELLKFETALLVLVTAGLLVLAKMLSDLRAEVRGMREAGGSKPAAAPAPSAAAPQPDPDKGIPPDVFAAIVCAVHYTLGESHHIVSVSPAESLAWSREGRRSIFRSHSIR
ncbi:MAG: hypothetical protein D4R65_08535 [Verrucomicrobiaceae bacterium]|nr:MAG: hypothetical protein D4R65_08535 [Verrucomicrobiaceae bacterium]